MTGTRVVSAIRADRSTPSSLRQVSDIYCRIGLKLGRGRRQFAPAVTGLIEQQAAIAQQFVDFCQPSAYLFGLKLQQPFARLGSVALRFEVAGLLRQLLVLRFALQFFGGGAFDLRGQRVHAFSHLGDQGFDALQHARRRTVTLFECGDPGSMFRAGLAASSRR